MAALSRWACLPLLLVASFISLASAARIFPVDTDDHSSISAASATYDDFDWLPVTGVKRKLSAIPSQHHTDDHSFVSTVVDGEGDKESLFRHSSGEEINELMDDLEDVGVDNSNIECDTFLCGWGGGGGGSIGGGGGGWGGIGNIGGGGGGGTGSIGGGGGGGRDEGGGGGGGDGCRTGGIGWSWSGGGFSGCGHVGRGGGDGGGVGWSWGGPGIGGSGNIGGDAGRNSWQWGWHWGGGGSKVAALNPHNGAYGMSAETATAPAPMSN
ncbi:glycine-rich cell wall structural protein 1-like isoform X1 [Daucus carota subsp. sativus]|uniref:glycine-rich cell wall structural protein 1-like isoform X1 n=1 Tax=Daucus carota subsp. sativus TaxID=79200 RepID=UPI003082D6E4